MPDIDQILLIDDEPDLRALAELALETFGGFDVITAGSGQRGLELAECERPDLILLDVMMPEMDGEATFAELQQRPATREIPVVFLTARSPRGSDSKLGSLDAAGVIEKPFRPDGLIRQIESIATELDRH